MLKSFQRVLRLLPNTLQWSPHSADALQEGISVLRNLEVLEIVGARSLRMENGIGKLANLQSFELNSCE